MFMSSGFFGVSGLAAGSSLGRREEVRLRHMSAVSGKVLRHWSARYLSAEDTRAVRYLIVNGFFRVCDFGIRRVRVCDFGFCRVLRLLNASQDDIQKRRKDWLILVAGMPG